MRRAICLAAIILCSDCVNVVQNTPWSAEPIDYDPCRKIEKRDEKRPVTDYMDRCSITNKTNSSLTYI
jgi:hypothetical protein